MTKSASSGAGTHLGADVRSHDDERVLEGHSAALAVCEATVLKDLEQHVEHVGVRLLNFIQKDDGERTAPDRLCQDTALAVANIPCKRQARL